ncbi:uncharacterized protein LOC122850330 [Aphidius gifuensis]|uniref:uncharacterized protein LOC122850330 n=1 Tax=Aphidius gifuensis TaxID=684658 RepID=UPI001CDCB107|nr:uncharacterized protein LOC122850330 [Aphidius gifuensis]XP_044005431.1 uncharacterized protein LOC122850330 [Aphidius gifuensis]XP_044005439.1 uncharacterized protein LOC122850330 [Aphidius gifuensis]XP_044005445.1 uncharacterized protein LOC122850330 [Aphidius gifuensis]
MARIILFMILGGLVWSTEALIGYDCASRITNSTLISSLDVEDCLPSQQPIERKNTRGTLIQRNPFISVPVRHCKVAISRHIYHCGMVTDYVSVVEGGIAEYIHEVGFDNCRNAHQQGFLYVSHMMVTGLRVNHTVPKQITLAGTLNKEGDCSGASYSDVFGQYDNVVVTASVQITLVASEAKVEIKQDKIFFNSGTTCKYTEGACMDSFGGNTYWDVIPAHDACEKEYSILYKGDLNLVQSGLDRYISVVSGSTTFSLKLTHQLSEFTICKHSTWPTEHPRLFVIPNEIDNVLPKSSKIEPDLLTYVDSKFVFVERHIRTQLETLHIDFEINKCLLQKQILGNQISIAASSPDEFAYRYMGQPGYMAINAGEVIHLVKCAPIPAKLRHTEQCYNMLPVTVNRIPLFITPRTHIITHDAAVIPCNVPLPQMFYIENAWYKFTPKPTNTIEPVKLNPNRKSTWVYANIGDLANSGIYSKDDMERMRERIMFPVEQTSILNTFAARASSSNIVADSRSFMKVFGETDLQEMAGRFWDNRWREFMVFSNISAGILGLLAVFQVVKMIADTFLHCFALHQVYGFSIHLFAALWDSLASLFLHQRKEETKRSVKDLKEKTNEELAEQTVPEGSVQHETYTSFNHLSEQRLYPTMNNVSVIYDKPTAPSTSRTTYLD